MKLFLAIAIVGAVVGGLVGWVRSTRDLSRRSLDPLDPALPAGRGHANELQRRMRGRFVTTFVYAILGVIVTFVAVALAARFF